MPTNKEIFNAKMDALANSINAKAGTTGAKDLDALKTAVDGIETGVKPSYCFNDGDEITEMYFNTASDLSVFLSGLEYTETDPYFGYDACPLGLGFYGVDYGDGDYGLIWTDENDGIELYTTVDGWIETEFTPSEPFEVDLSELNEGFAEIIDYVVATEDIVFGARGIFPSGNQDIENLNQYSVYDKSTARISATERAKIIPENIAEGVTILGVQGTHQGGGGKAHTFQVPTISGTYTYTGSAQTAVIVGFYSDFMTKSGDTSATNAGSYSITFALTDTTNCQWSDGTITNKTVSWSIAKAALPKPTLSKNSIKLNPDNTSDTFTVTRAGDGTISVVSSNPSKVSASISGTMVTVTALDTSADATADITVTVAEGTNYLAYTEQDVVFSVEISSSTAITATVSNLGAEDPTTVTFAKDSDFTVQGLGIEQVTMGGDTFIKIPTMYRKVNTVTDGQITSFTMANGQVDNDYKPYSVFVAEDGTTVLPYVLIGKYWNTSPSSMVSTTATNSTAKLKIGNARTYAQNRGTGYQQYDWQFQKLWQDLIIIIKETVNTNAGVAWTYDELGIYWSTINCWADGICHNGNIIAVSYKPSKYINNATTSTDGYVSVSYNLPTKNSQEIKKLGYDANNPFVNYPSATEINSSYNTYYCDMYNYSSTDPRPISLSVGLAYADYGAFHCGASSNFSDTNSVRLCYRPISS